MTKPRDPEALLSAYLAEGMEVLSDRVVDAVLDEAHRTPQRVVFGRWRGRSMSRATLAAAVVVGVIALGGALAVAGPRPKPQPTAPPSPSLPVVVAPHSTPSVPPTTVPGFPRSTGTWIATSSMGTPRTGHTSVRLLDGRVLVVGGASDENERSAEIYDPDTGTWSATGNMLKPHSGFLAFPATLLRDGRVLVGDADDPGALDPTFGAEVYDPDSGTWTPTGRMIKANPGTATLLRDGRVLVTGSDGTHPSCMTRTAARGLPQEDGHIEAWPRRHPVPDGRVLVVGGFDVSNRPRIRLRGALRPRHGIWTAIAPMHRAKAAIGSRCCSMATCSLWVGPTFTRRRPRSCTTRPAGHGPSPGTRLGPARPTRRPRCCRTALVLPDRSALCRAVRPGHRVLDQHHGHARAARRGSIRPRCCLTGPSS